MKEMRVQSPGWRDALDEEMATHSSGLSWEVPRTEEPGGLQSVGSHRAGHDLATAHACTMPQTLFGKLSGSYPLCLYNLWGLFWSHLSQVEKLACLSFRPPLSSPKEKINFLFWNPLEHTGCFSYETYTVPWACNNWRILPSLPHCQLPENGATFRQQH